jgi:hypothetical protein
MFHSLINNCWVRASANPSFSALMNYANTKARVKKFVTKNMTKKIRLAAVKRNLG